MVLGIEVVWNIAALNPNNLLAVRKKHSSGNYCRLKSLVFVRLNIEYPGITASAGNNLLLKYSQVRFQKEFGGTRRGGSKGALQETFQFRITQIAGIPLAFFKPLQSRFGCE